MKEAQGEFAKVAPVLETTLKKHQYLAGDKFSAADIMVGTTLAWVNYAHGLEKHPVLREYLGRLASRPAYKKTFGDKPASIA